MRPPPFLGTLLSTAALLAGCASAPAPAVNPSATPAELQARYPADVAACRADAISAWAGVLDTAVQGALVAAMLAWGAGGDADTVRDWALGGGVLVGGSEGLAALERQRQAVARCLRARGHGAAPLRPTVAAPASAPALALSPPPPIAGVDAFSAERLARQQACHDQPRALLATKGPGFETYTVACRSGDALAIRCEFGQCRVLR